MKLGIKPPPLNQWLPFIAGLLSLCLLLMAALTLLSDHFEPKSPQSAVVTSPSAHGFMGLRRALDGHGYETYLNRYKNPSKAIKGDIEIITLEWNSPVLQSDIPRFDDKKPQSDDARSETSLSSDNSDSSHSSSESSSSFVPRPRKPLARNDARDSYEWLEPFYKQSDQLHYEPNGRVVLLIAPKWRTFPVPKKPRWAMGPWLMNTSYVANMLSFATTFKYGPEKASQLTLEKEAKQAQKEAAEAALEGRVYVPPKKVETKDQSLEEWWSYEEAHEIKMTRQSEWSNNREVPLMRPIILKPAQGQDLFATDLNFGRVEGLQGLSSPRLIPILLGPDGQAILSKVVSGSEFLPIKSPIYVLSDPDIVNNQILAKPEKLATALLIIDTITPQPENAKPRRVVFNLVYNRLSYDEDIFHYISRPPYLALPLGVFILCLGLMWTAFSRFGPPVETAKAAPLGRGAKILANNAARLVALAMRETHMGSFYAQMIRDSVLKSRLEHSMFGHQAIEPDELAERIGKLYGAKDSFIALKTAIQNPNNVATLIGLAQRLRAWKQDIVNKSKP